jgi:hypothetical protein
VHSLGRAIYRFKLRKEAPCALILQDRLLDVPLPLEGFPVRVCLLICALEENGGTDIQAVYRDFGRPEQFMVWTASESEPEPKPLHEFGHGPHASERVHVLCDGEQLSGSLGDDTWVGAACAVVEFKASGEHRIVNFHTASADRRNDWLSSVSLRLG